MPHLAAGWEESRTPVATSPPKPLTRLLPSPTQTRTLVRRAAGRQQNRVSAAQWGFRINGSWLGSSGHSPGLTGCSRCHRFTGPGEPLQRPGPCPSPGVPSAHTPLPNLPSAAPPGRAARPVCPAVLQGAGAQPGQGVGALGVLVLPWLSSGASCPPYSCPTCSTSHTPCACWCRRRRAWTSSR